MTTNVRMITPVTPKLAGELAATERVLASLDKLEALHGLGNQRGLNDRAHYVEVADTLEALAIATLSATSGAPADGAEAGWLAAALLAAAGTAYFTLSRPHLPDPSRRTAPKPR